MSKWEKSAGCGVGRVGVEQRELVCTCKPCQSGSNPCQRGKTLRVGMVRVVGLQGEVVCTCGCVWLELEGLCGSVGQLGLSSSLILC